MPNWSVQDIPPQAGRLAVVTGATGGLGYETALALAGAGADVVLTGRNDDKGRVALERIRAAHPAAAIRYLHLDMADLASVRAFAESFARGHDALDLLVNNAGVMMLPQRQVTIDGFELQFGTNYLGHFALTAHLLPLLRASRAPRVVNLGSLVHKFGGAIHFDDLQFARRYRPFAAYAQSKLAMLMFAFELQRRSDANGWRIHAVAAHPGYARTDLIANGPGEGALQRIDAVTVRPLLSHSAKEGALPTLFAATSPQAVPGGYYGPSGLFEMKGPVAQAKVASGARDEAAAARLWNVSCGLTNTSWPETNAEGKR